MFSPEPLFMLAIDLFDRILQLGFHNFRLFSVRLGWRSLYHTSPRPRRANSD